MTGCTSAASVAFARSRWALAVVRSSAPCSLGREDDLRGFLDTDGETDQDVITVSTRRLKTSPSDCKPSVSSPFALLSTEPDRSSFVGAFPGALDSARPQFASTLGDPAYGGLAGVRILLERGYFRGPPAGAQPPHQSVACIPSFGPATNTRAGEASGSSLLFPGTAPVAQWTEQQPSKLTVAGSNPAGGAERAT
jgi:hypothetical protein